MHIDGGFCLIGKMSRVDWCVFTHDKWNICYSLCKN